MTVPAPRSSDDQVLGLVLDGVREVKESVQRMQSDMAHRFDNLDQKFVPRAELESRFNDSLRDRSDIRQVISEGKAKHDSDITRVSSSVQNLEDKLTASRRYAYTTSIAAAVLIVTLLSFILTHLPG